MSIADIVVQLDEALDEIDAVRVLLGNSTDLIDEVVAIMGAAVDGSAAPDAVHALALFGEVQQGLQTPFAVLQTAESAIREYRAYLVGQTVAASRSADVPNVKPERARPSATPVGEVSGKDEKSTAAPELNHHRFDREDLESKIPKYGEDGTLTTYGNAIDDNGVYYGHDLIRSGNKSADRD